MAEIWEIEGREPTEREKLFAESRKRMTERVARYDERLLTVIKNHLGFEDCLNELLKAASRRWKNRTCAGKIAVGKEINPPEIEKAVWDVVDAGNKLRNAVAHGHKESVIATRIAEFRSAHIAALTPQGAKGLKELDDNRAIELAYNFCGAYMVGAAEGEKARRKK
ncbi:hypothetical protein [Bradyrhizobium sp. AUGA SZCCT0042]|uniref:hypothetical protein n=1 Tax=Bradyrhizobium sp. AUGA SZCCT0042 TaxID=2807651 RepID=UPI001BABE136|nr:hypothetical protein [Bradyrhizobium sp. AUGA SZCCT0042]MBR1297386.1 hypothetical protein [Bradyrhizobium sp. AUGA SZCCT0042]